MEIVVDVLTEVAQTHSTVGVDVDRCKYVVVVMIVVRLRNVAMVDVVQMGRCVVITFVKQYAMVDAQIVVVLDVVQNLNLVVQQTVYVNHFAPALPYVQIHLHHVVLVDVMTMNGVAKVVMSVVQQ